MSLQLVPIMQEQMAILDGANRTYAEKTAAVRTMLVACETELANPILNDVSVSADLRQQKLVDLEALRNAIYAARDRVLGDNVHPRTFRVPGNEPMSLWQIAKQLWGDGRRWAELMNGNAITNANAVRPGTVLVVLS
jgi:hypothetical protein